MRIFFVDQITRKQCGLDVRNDGSDSIEKVKEMLAEESNSLGGRQKIPPHQLWLLHFVGLVRKERRGYTQVSREPNTWVPIDTPQGLAEREQGEEERERTLQAGRTLSDYNIQNEDTIIFTFSLEDPSHLQPPSVSVGSLAKAGALHHFQPELFKDEWAAGGLSWGKRVANEMLTGLNNERERAFLGAAPLGEDIYISEAYCVAHAPAEGHVVVAAFLNGAAGAALDGRPLLFHFAFPDNYPFSSFRPSLLTTLPEHPALATHAGHCEQSVGLSEYGEVCGGYFRKRWSPLCTVPGYLMHAVKRLLAPPIDGSDMPGGSDMPHFPEPALTSRWGHDWEGTLLEQLRGARHLSPLDLVPSRGLWSDCPCVSTDRWTQFTHHQSTRESRDRAIATFIVALRLEEKEPEECPLPPEIWVLILEMAHGHELVFVRSV